MSVRFRLSAQIARWCNGSTIDFGSISFGSNPGRVTFNFIFKSMNEEKYIIFEPYRCGLSNVLMSFELAFSLAHITSRTLIMPPKIWWEQLDYGKQKENWTNIWDILDLDRVKEEIKIIDLFEFEPIKNNIDHITSHGWYFTEYITDYIDDYYHFTNRHEPEEHRNWDMIANTSCFANGIVDNDDFNQFSKSRCVIDVNRPEKYIIFKNNLFGHFWYQIYAGDKEKRNELKRIINKCLRYKERYYQLAEKLFPLKIFNAVHIRSGEPRDVHQFTATSFGEIKGLYDGDYILNSVKQIIKNDKPLFVANDLKDKNILNQLKSEYPCITIDEIDNTLNEMEKALVEQLICVKADYYVGTYACTYSKRINIMRGIEGKQTADFMGLNYIKENEQEHFGVSFPWNENGLEHWPWHWSSYPHWNFE